MPTLFLLFSHTLTEEQRADARRTLGVRRFVRLPADLQARWSAVPPDADRIDAHLQPVLDWLAAQARPGDYVLAQGDFGAIFLAVTFALGRGLRPIYATTARQVRETRRPDGQVEVQRVFRHARFRPYMPYRRLDDQDTR
jgi:hypothetical protein